MYDLYSLTEKINKESEEEEKVKIETAKPILCSSKGDTVADKIDTAAKKSRDKIVGLEIVSKTDNLASKKESRKRLDLCFLESDNASRKNRGLAKSSGDDATKIDEAVASSFMDKMTDKNTENTVEGIKEARSLAYAPPIECQRRRRRGGEKNTEVADNEGGNPKQRKKEHRLELGLPFANEAVRRFAHGNTTTEASDIFAGNQNSEDICTIPPPKKGHMLELAPPFANEDVRRFACGNTTAEASDILVDNQNSGDISIIPPPGAFNIVPGYEPEERLLEVLFKDEETIAHIIDNSSPAVCEIKIPEAKLVDEVPEALLVEEDGERTERKNNKWKRYLILSTIIMIVFLAIIIPLSITLTRPPLIITLTGPTTAENFDSCLSVFYFNSNGKYWTNKIDWLQSRDECDWYGVQCMDDDVFELKLANNNVSGNVTLSGDCLDKLNIFDLSQNSIQKIDSNIGLLKNLSVLDISYNNLENIYSELGLLTKLSFLWLHGNPNLEGRIPSEVADLMIRNDKINVSKTILSHVPVSRSTLFEYGTSQFRAFNDILYRYRMQQDEISLSSTDLVYRYILGTFYFATNGDRWKRNDKWLTPANHCTWYGVDCNTDDEVTKLDLYNNNVDGTLLKELWDLRKLTYLSLGTNSLRGLIVSEIGQLTDLKVLSLYHNAFTGSIPSELGLLTGLEYLYLKQNELSGSIPNELGQLTNLEFLSIEKNNLTDTIPSALCDNMVYIIGIDCPQVAKCACCKCY